MSIIQTDLKWGYTPTRFTQPAKYLVLHHAAGNGSVEAIHAYHRDTNGWAGIAYHLYVRKDGKVYAGRPMDKQGGHCLNYNGVSIGICFEGNFETETMSAAQMTGGVEAITYAMAHYPGMKIVGHRELGSTSCPGKNFPLNYFKHYDEAVEAEEEDQGVEVDYYGKVTASALNCRTAPSTKTGAIVSSYTNGAVVHISREKGGWGLTPDGWVSLQWIEKTDMPKEEEEEMDISKLTPEQCYTILQKAQEHVAAQPVPDWAREELQEAIDSGITDGSDMMQFIPRYQAAIMAARAQRGGAK